MKLTSEQLQSRILANPTNTILKSEDLYPDKYTICKIKPEEKIDMPLNFNGKEAWKDYLSNVVDQGSCGSCWAFATTSLLADKFNIQTRGDLKLQLSPTKLILCGKNFEVEHPIHRIEEEIKIGSVSTSQKQNIYNINNYACYGNSLYNALHYLYLFGTCLDSCIPYNKNFGMQSEFQKIGEFTSPEKLPLCEYISGPIGDMCSNFFIESLSGIEGGTPSRFYRAYEIYGIAGTEEDGGSELLIRYDIYKWGPVVSAFKVYEDFYEFDSKNGIYEWNGKGEQVGGHAIEIVGWGEENGKKYWQIKNSWGTGWGDDGYFKMIRGKNNCEIESNTYSIIPDFFHDNEIKIVSKYGLECKDNTLKKIRYDIDNNINIIGGGIDPYTGFSRRVMRTFNNIDFSPPIKELPNFEGFIAGKVKNEIVKLNKPEPIVIKHKNSFGFILTLTFVSIAIIFLIFIIIKFY